MQATKEEAVRANSILSGYAQIIMKEDYNILMEFILAAQKRLPSQAAVDRDRTRRKKPA